MIQFLSGNLADVNAKFLVLDVIEVAPSKIGKSIDFPGTPFSNKVISQWPDTKVRFQRYLRTQTLSGGEMWVDPASSDPKKIVLIATHRAPTQPSMPFLRMALKRLSRWADRHGVESICVARSGGDLSLSADNQIKQVYYEQLSDSRCTFIVLENEITRNCSAAQSLVGQASSGLFSTNTNRMTGNSRSAALGKIVNARQKINRVLSVDASPIESA